jgi:hypothetical protein
MVLTGPKDNNDFIVIIKHFSRAESKGREFNKAIKNKNVTKKS